jgi:hypothetical protein
LERESSPSSRPLLSQNPADCESEQKVTNHERRIRALSKQQASRTWRSFSDNVLRMTLILFPAVVGRGDGFFTSGVSSRKRPSDFPAVVGLDVCFIPDLGLCSDLPAVVGRRAGCISISDALLRLKRGDLAAVVGLAGGGISELSDAAATRVSPAEELERAAWVNTGIRGGCFSALRPRMIFAAVLGLRAACIPPFLETLELRLAAAANGGWDGGGGGVGMIGQTWWSGTSTVEKGLSRGSFPS